MHNLFTLLNKVIKKLLNTLKIKPPKSNNCIGPELFLIWDRAETWAKVIMEDPTDHAKISPKLIISTHKISFSKQISNTLTFNFLSLFLEFFRKSVSRFNADYISLFKMTLTAIRKCSRRKAKPYGQIKLLTFEKSNFHFDESQTTTS